MIDTLIKLLEKFIELAKTKREIEIRAFELLIKPMYADMKIIHEDYLHLFTSCGRDLSEGVEISIIAKKLVGDRLEQEALRHSISSFVHSYLQNPQLETYYSFFMAVIGYLHGSNPWQGTRSEMVLHRLEHCAREESKGKLFSISNEDGLQTTNTLMRMLRAVLLEIRKA